MSYRGKEKEINNLPTSHTFEEKQKRSLIFRPKRFSSICICWKYLSLALIGWLCLVHYYERVVVKRAMKKCVWTSWETWSPNATPHRVALFADPQIMDSFSYPNRPWIVNWFTQQVLDNYHSRNWRYVNYYLDPESIFFLGDLFDGGWASGIDDWMQEYDRFNHIFPKKPNRLTVMSLPGNHDIGFGDTIIETSLRRFTTFFGETSSEWVIGNHTVVLLDTISLSNKANENISVIPRTFLNNFKFYNYPRILLTHVPLWRHPEQQICGDIRESKKTFPISKGEQYQTVIDGDLTQEILMKIQPSIVFSGDDHDYCHIGHSYHLDGIAKISEEVTVKSCAMNMGINKPAIQLLSLYNPTSDFNTNDKTYQSQICYMPDPFRPIIAYLIYLGISLGFLLWGHFKQPPFYKTMSLGVTIIGDHHNSILPRFTKKDLNSLKISPNSYPTGIFKNILNFFINGLILMTGITFIFYYYYKKF